MDNHNAYDEMMNRLDEKEREQERKNKELFDKQIVPEIQSMLHGGVVDWNPWGYPMHKNNNNPQDTAFRWKDLLNNNIL